MTQPTSRMERDREARAITRANGEAFAANVEDLFGPEHIELEEGK